MSVQLIVYPQSYGGQFNEFSSSSSESIVNGINFLNLNNTSTYTSTQIVPYEDTLINAPADIVNTWYRFRKGSIAFPTSLLGNVTLVSSEISGIYQKLSSLTIGGQYTLTINIPTAIVGGSVEVGVYVGSTWQTSTSYNSNVTQISKTFYASATEMIIMISYYNSTSTDLVISSVSANPIIGAIPSGSSSILDNGQVICDLYEDEDIPLTLSVDNFKNVAEKVQSYSKAFNLPATKRNNKIFDQLFEITRSDDGVIFNVYKKTQCVLKQDGFILFEGYLRLLDIVDKNGEISYNVNLYSEVIALADFLKDSDFRALDFTELTHDYNKTQIRYSWNDNTTGITYANANTSGFRDAYNTLKYPFVNWNNNIEISSGTPVLTSLEQVFRPFINVKYLIERIFQTTPFTFESEFFDTDEFKKLFMDFNWGSDNTPSIAGVTTFLGQWAKQIGASVKPSVYAGTTFTDLELYFSQFLLNTPPPNYNISTNIITATVDGEQYAISGFYKIENTSATDTIVVDCQWTHNSTGFSLSQLTLAPLSFQKFNFNFNRTLLSGDTLKAQFKRNDSLSTATIRQLESNVLVSSIVTFNVSAVAITTNTFLQTLRGETGQWEFLKGLITMFNLVTIPDKDNPNNIKIEPYTDVFGSDGDGIQLNWTDKIDTSEMKLTPLADLNKRSIFKFVEDEDDFAFINYKNQVGGHLYGSKKYDAGNEFNILEGLNEVIAEPFAATVVKPLFIPNFPQFITPAIYAYNPETEESEGFENSPRIMYNNGIKDSGTTYYIPPQNGVVGSAAEPDFLQFSHLSDVPTIVSDPPANTDSSDYHFGECQLLTGVGSATVNNLFNLYWLPYYSELYNPNTRIMTIKVNLSPADINTFKFNDTVFIKNRTFRVNKIDYKPNDLATVEFILIP